MTEGFLAVSSHLSTQLPLEEFHEWYEEEHIPLRLNHFKEFLSGARYKVVPPKNQSNDINAEATQSSWLALYIVESPTIFSSSSYQNLRINRSEREKNVMSRIEVLTRITGEIVGTHLNGEQKTTGFKPGRPSGWVVTHGISTRGVDGSDITSWATQVKQEVAKYGDIKEGWARTLIVLVLETGVSRFGRSVEANEEVRMSYFVVHEFKDRESAESFSEQIFESANIGVEVGARTIWELYKAYPCIAQGNDG